MLSKKYLIGIVTAVVLVAIAIGVGLGVDWNKDEEEPTSNATPSIIGASKAVRITKDEMTNEEGGKVRSKYNYTISEPGSPYIAIHFSNFDFNRECTMELTDTEGALVASYTDRGRRNRRNFWAHHVEGDTLNILVYCVVAAGDNKAKFEIDEIVAGFPEEDLLSLEEPDRRQTPERNLRADQLFPFDSDRHPSRMLSLCGDDDGKNAVCYRDSHPAEYTLAKAVSRLKIGGKGSCTGWLVGPNNLLMTNFHCIGTAADLAATDFQFMAEGANCDDSKTTTAGYDVYDGIEIVASSYSKDYCLVRLDGDPASKYGYMELDDRRAIPGETIYIPGHPQGRAKQFALEDSWATSGGTGGRCGILDVGNDSCGYSRAYDSIQYTCDTLGGNSGSPIVAVDTMKAIGLHHCGHLNCGLGNLAVPMEAGGIYMDIKDFVDVPAPETPAPSTSSPTAAPKTPSPTTPRPTEGPPSTTPPTQNPTAEGTLICYAPKMRIEIQLDDFAAETRWELWQSDPPRMISDGDNYENNALIQEEHCLADDSLHTLKFFDDFGDGFCCNKGFGYYKVYYNEWLIYHNNGDTGAFTEMDISPSQVCLDIPFHLTLDTDSFGGETTWDLKDSVGTVMAEGGPYPGQFRLVEEQICVTSLGEMTFTVYDSFGDGMCCQGGNGKFKLYRNGDLKIDSDGKFSIFVRYSVPALGEAIIIEGGLIEG